ncbi:MAG: hypothetical protein KGO83_06860, partial [Paenibacillaceae bacterium]|nr:hypothetical protein [Paenibacillaceae bacterium]
MPRYIVEKYARKFLGTTHPLLHISVSTPLDAPTHSYFITSILSNKTAFCLIAKSILWNDVFIKTRIRNKKTYVSLLPRSACGCHPIARTKDACMCSRVVGKCNLS